MLTKGKILKGGKKFVDVSKGPLGSAVTGLGVGTLVNVADKQFLGGRMASYGLAIPGGYTVDGKALNINGTDVATYVAINGIRVPSKGGLLTALITIGVKKYAELKGWIDPMEYNYSNNTTTTGSSPMAPLAMPSGGLSHT